MNMTDLELLEAAAKAAGVKYDIGASRPHPTSGAFWGLWLLFDGEPGEYTRRYWNPLTDDGDALRLAVKLELQVFPCDLPGRSLATDGGDIIGGAMHDGDPYAATRRAIVRAAAVA